LNFDSYVIKITLFASLLSAKIEFLALSEKLNFQLNINTITPMNRFNRTYQNLTSGVTVQPIYLYNEHNGNTVMNYDDDVKIPITKILKNIPGEKVLMKLNHNREGKFIEPFTELPFLNGTIHPVDKSEIIRQVNENRRLFIGNGLDWKATEFNYTVKCGKSSMKIDINDILDHLESCEKCKINFIFIPPANDICDVCKSNPKIYGKICYDGCANNLRSYLPEIFSCGDTIKRIFPFGDVRILSYTFHADDIQW